MLITLISAGAGIVPMLLLEPSFWRICLTTLCVEIVMIPLIWFVVFDDFEKKFVIERVGKFFKER
jgi:hypothetical protein